MKPSAILLDRTPATSGAAPRGQHDLHRGQGSSTICGPSVRRRSRSVSVGLVAVAKLAALGSGRLGIWTPAEARAAGLSSDAVRRRVSNGTWQQLHGRSLTDAGHRLDDRQRVAAALAAVGEDAVAAGRLAARWWSLPVIDDSEPLLGRGQAGLDDVICPRRLARRGRLVPHRWALREDEILEVDGIRVTTALRTLVDLSILLRLDALLCAGDAAVRARRVTRAQLLAAAAVRRGRPGGPALAWAAAWVDGRAQSPLETLTRICLWSPQLPAFTPQLEVCDDEGRVLAALDHGVSELRFGVESDGAGPHNLPEARYTDRHREARLAERRYLLQRVTWTDARGHRARIRSRAAAAVREQAARLSVDPDELPRSALPPPPTAIWR